MNARLVQLLEHLDRTLTVERETEIEELHRRALSWDRVPRLPLAVPRPLAYSKGLYRA